MNRSMFSVLGVFAAISFVGCGSDKSAGETGAGGEDGGPTGCQVEYETVPASDANDWYYLSPVEALLSEGDASATITLADGSGADVAGTVTLEDDNTRVIFTPSAPLSPSTDYSMTVSTCDGEGGGSISFRTSDLGGPITCDLTGKSYRVDLLSARFIQPGEAIASLLFEQLSDDILIGVSAQNETSLNMLGALSDGAGGNQNHCYPSIDFPEAASFSDPGFSVGPADTTLEVAGYSIEISNLGISGSFAPDCSYFGGGKLVGELDARVLAPLVSELVGTDDPDEICGFLVTFGVACETCSSDGAPYCAAVEVDQINAAEIAGESIDCVSLEECHPECASSACLNTADGDCNAE